MRIAKIATPTIRVPFSRSNENASSSASGSSVPATTARPSASEQEMRTSALRSDRRRAIAKAARPIASTSPTARIAVSSGGRRSASTGAIGADAG